MPLMIRMDDIVNMHCDAIVTATDPELSGLRGIDHDIHQAAGPALAAACRAYGPQPIGGVVLTEGYQLSRYIIHAVSPVWTGQPDEMKVLAACYQRAFALAQSVGCRSLAAPLIASGGFGFPPDTVLQTAVAEARTFLEQYPMDLFIVTHRQSTFNLAVRMFAGSLERINDKKIRLAAQNGTLALDELLNQRHETFREMLLRKIQERGITNVQCYTSAFVSRSVFSSILTKKNYTPSKQTVAALALALELPIEEALELFGKAGYYLTNTNPFDIIIEYFIEQGNYDLFDVNDALYRHGLPPLGG